MIVYELSNERYEGTIEYAALGKVTLTCFSSASSNLDFVIMLIGVASQFVNEHSRSKTPNKYQRKIANIFASSYLADLDIKPYLVSQFGDGSFKLFLNFNKYIKDNGNKLNNESKANF